MRGFARTPLGQGLIRALILLMLFYTGPWLELLRAHPLNPDRLAWRAEQRLGTLVEWLFPAAQAQGGLCDLDADSDVDRNDINAVIARRNQPAQGAGDPADADGNGWIDTNDARQCVLQCTLARCAEPSANNPPTADAGADRNTFVGASVSLDGRGSSDPDGDALSYGWRFTALPADSTAALTGADTATPSFTVDAPGEYRIELIVNDGSLDSAPDAVSVVTVNRPPTAAAGPDRSAAVGTVVTLDGSASSDPDGDALSYLWRLSGLPDDSGAALDDPTAVAPSFRIDLPGDYTAELIVNDGLLDSAPDETVVSTVNSAPVADAGPPQSALVGATVTLDGTASSDVDGDPLSYRWRFDSRPAGSATALDDPSSAMPRFAIDAFGDYVIELIVNDGALDSAPDTTTVSTDNSAPVADAGPPQSGFIGDTVTLDGRGSFDPDGDALGYGWSFTARPSGSAAAFDDAASATPSFVIDVFGDYTARLVVDDGLLASAPATTTVSTINSRPVADAGGDQTVPAGATVDLDGTGSSDADGHALTYQWSITTAPDDSNAALSDENAERPSFVADLPGLYVIQLIVNDGFENSDPSTVSIQAQAVVPDLVGLAQAAAEAALLAAALAVGAITQQNSDRVPAGDVISQDPAAGTRVAAGSAVDLVVSLGPVAVSVPDVAGLEQATAEAAFTSAGLVVGTVTTANSDSVPAGSVISQNPVGGTDVPAGSAVDLVVSLGPVLVSVPDVVGQPQAAAEAAITDAGLVVGTVATANSDLVPAGSVISQTPVGATDVPEGSAVDLVVSSGPVPGPGDITRPGVTLTLTPDSAAVGEPIDIQVDAFDDVGVVATELTVDGVSVPLDPSGAATYSSATAGVFAAIAIARDAAGNEGQAASDARFLASTGDTTPPTVAFAQPVDNAVLTLPTEITGTATDDAQLVRYVLEYSVRGRNEFVRFAEGTSPIDNDVLGTFDPTMLRNGLYDVRLTAEDADGNSASITRVYQADGEMKVGNFIITFQDLSISVAGIPITIERTYDSRDRAKGDFGFGWSLEVRTGAVQEDRIPGEGWQLVCIRQIFGTCLEWGIDPSVDHTVIITRGDGRTDEFRITANTSFAQPGGLAQGNLSFTPIGGTFSTLEALDNTTYDLLLGGDLLDFNFNVIDPNRYRLTDPDGTQFVIDQSDGLESVTDPNGNTISFGPNGIIHSAGKSVLFNRDAMNRISSIVDPLGNTISYEYDFYGDLVTVTDQVGNPTRFTYNSSHGLLDIVDAAGARFVRSEYDQSGRLVAIVDADGNRTEIENALSSRQEISTDRLGRVTILGYDDDGNVTSRTDPLGNTTLYTFDANGNATSETDALGNTTTRTFDAQDRQLSDTDPLGNTRTFTYDDGGRILTATDARGNTLSNTYDARGNLLTSTDPLGNSDQYTYDAAGNRLTATDPLGNVTSFTYDSFGNRLSVNDAMGGVTEFTYDANGNQLTRSTTRTNAAGGTVTFTVTQTYDALNRLESRDSPISAPLDLFDGINPNLRLFPKTTNPTGIDQLGGFTRVEYRERGGVSALIDARGGRTELEYDALDRLIRITYPDGLTESATYDAEGNQLKFVDRAGRATSYEYDAADQLLRTVHPDGTALQIGYDAVGRVVSETDENGNQTTHTYDAAGRRVSTTDPLGNTTSFTYDAAGNVLTQTDALGRTTTFEYDARNRVTRTTFENGSFNTTEYDAAGRRSAVVDQAGNRTEYAYDGMSRLLSVTNALGQTTSYEYDEVGNRVAEIDANGNRTSFAYDDLGRLIGTELPLGMTESFTYDASGNRIAHTDFNGRITSTVFDELSRPIRRSFAHGSEILWTYTPTGQIAMMDDGSGVRRHSYDARDRLIEVENPDGTFLRYGYDAAGNRTSVETPLGTTVYGFDALNRLASVTDRSGGLTTYGFDDVGNRASLTRPNGTTTTYTYDGLNRLTDIVHRRSDNSVITSHTYTLGPAGNRVRVVDAGGRQVDYTYDAVYKLTQETVTDPGVSVTDYAYDDVGNILTKTVDGRATSYTYDANDRLLSVGATTYTYDDNGNMVSRNDGALTTYTYDPQDRLIEVAEPGATTVYTYDGHGHRVGRSVNGVETRYLVDTNRDFAQVVEERDGAGAVLVEYTHGDDLLRQLRGGAISYYHFDGVNSTRALTDAAQATTDTYAFDAFGNLGGSTGSTVNEFLFAGEQLDGNIGFYHLRARWYDPSIARFTSRDPFNGVIFDPISLHKYLYARANPVNVFDPSGQTNLISMSAVTTTIGTLARAAVVNVSRFTLVRVALLSQRIYALTGAAAAAAWARVQSASIGIRHLIAGPAARWWGVTGNNVHQGIRHFFEYGLPPNGRTRYPATSIRSPNC